MIRIIPSALVLAIGLLTASGAHAQVRELELFVVMDGEFTQRIAPVTPRAWIDTLIAEANVWWERDLNIRLKLVRLDAFTDPAADPFGSSDAQGLLDEIKAYGNAISFPRDATHLFSGRHMPYGGYTYLNVTCESPTFSYGWSLLGFWGYTWTHSAFSVELTHQLGAHYVDTIPSCDGALLGKDVQLVDFRNNWFCAASRAEIDAHLATNPQCLSAVDLSQPPPPQATDTQAPVVTVTEPASNRIAPGTTFTIAAEATDNVGVDRVAFYLNGSLICTDLAAPYSCTAPLTAKKKNYRIEVWAYDSAGNVGSANKTVGVR